jgi:hypothetical protein
MLTIKQNDDVRGWGARMAARESRRRRVEEITAALNPQAPTRVANDDAAAQQENVREFIHAMSIELARLAYRNKLDALAVAFDMAREIAESSKLASDEHLERT